MYKHYSFIKRENNLFKHLLENDRCSLYIWVDKMDMVKKIQFEVENKSAIEICSNKSIHCTISSEIYSRAFTHQTEFNQEIIDAISKIESEYESSSIEKIKTMLLTRKFTSFKFHTSQS